MSKTRILCPQCGYPVGWCNCMQHAMAQRGSLTPLFCDVCGGQLAHESAMSSNLLICTKCGIRVGVDTVWHANTAPKQEQPENEG